MVSQLLLPLLDRLSVALPSKSAVEVSCILSNAHPSFQSAATVSVRPVERSSVGSDSDGSSSEEDAGRVKVKSAVVQVREGCVCGKSMYICLISLAGTTERD